MNNCYIGFGVFSLLEIDYSVFVIAITALTLILQIILCFKSKKTVIKLIPTVISVITTVAFIVMISLSTGWEVLGYLLLAVFSAFVSAGCILCWIIYGIIKVFKRKPKEKITYQ